MKTRPEQYGDVVLDVPTGAGQSDIVRHESRTPASRALGLVQMLLGVAGLWFMKAENDLQVGTWLILSTGALGLLTGRWGVKEELWRKPSEPAALAAYRNRRIVQNVLWAAIYATFMAYLFWGPVGREALLVALVALVAASHLLGRWTKSTHARWLERVPAS